MPRQESFPWTSVSVPRPPCNSVLYGVLVDPYPYREANRVAFVNLYDKAGHPQGDIYFTMAQVDELRGAKSVGEVIAQRDVDMTSTDAELPQSTKVLQITGNGFEFLGAPPMLGRTFAASEALRLQGAYGSHISDVERGRKSMTLSLVPERLNPFRLHRLTS